jgi:hypothetical protein
MAMAGAEDPLGAYDPKRLIRQLMELDEPTPAGARECIVLWLMSLADDIDPADAARRLLDALPAGAAGTRTALAADLARELEEVARFPRPQLRAAGPARLARRRRAAARSMPS